MLALLLLNLLPFLFAAPPLVVKNGAICENKATGFFAVDNLALPEANDSIVYKDTSEDECLKTCSQNRDQFGRSILCASFVYDHSSFSCTIHKDKSIPEGKVSPTTSVGKRYFEKVCLNDEVPMQCADSQFIRSDNSVLVGFAVEVTLSDSLEDCLAFCVKNNTCKSAMYFYEENECIINTESALSKPDGFQKEENDKVIYFQNGCHGKKASVNAKKTTTEPPKEVSTTVEADEYEDVPMSEEEKGSDEFASYEDSDEMYDEDLDSGAGDFDVSTMDESNEKAKMVEKAAYTKFQKHHRNVAKKSSKTSEIDPSQAELNELADDLAALEQSIEKLTLEASANPKKAHGKKRKHLPIKKVEKTKEYPTYFSEWSDWTECKKSGERQIRRRKCLDLRRCLGALMQVQNCPAMIVPEQEKEVPVQSVRSVLGVPTEFDEQQAPLTQPNLPPVPTQVVSNVASQDTIWSPWLGTCQKFASGQPCNEGQMIGFESRECLALDPTFCEGPFFRYCTLQC